MSASDNFNYSQWGTNNYHTICGLIAESALYGIYIALVAYALRLLGFGDGNRSKPRLLTLFSLLLMFAVSTILWALDITDFLRGLHKILIDTDGTAVQRNADYLIELNPRVVIQTTFFSVEYLIGDAVVVWRACAVWGYSRKIIFLPILMLTSATVLVSIFVGCLGVHDWAYIAGEPETCYKSYLGVFFLSLSTNLMATTLIATRAWMHHRLLLRSSGQKSTVTRILILLVESGLIYLLIWATKSISAFGTLSSTLTGQFAVSMLNSMGNQIVGLYPTLLVS
ncbi:hypothetical protein BT96DRAFT_33261 [Gymnopus androsaceus JB14]|uniref:Uncharacterized protein n=1 Tax=Gymnopus androsaceus JB14 TaxID=1447944 RepID=A0A6A4HIZ5_9AGAR|nr:hypothetical protein BT96DRAFT_33261 [Gymnopus androsaceus JB14]